MTDRKGRGARLGEAEAWKTADLESTGLMEETGSCTHLVVIYAASEEGEAKILLPISQIGILKDQAVCPSIKEGTGTLVSGYRLPASLPFLKIFIIIFILIGG